MQAVLSDYLWVPRSAVKPHHLQAFSYRLFDTFANESYQVDTFTEELDHYRFPRGNLQKLRKVFGDTLQFDDQRVSVPSQQKLRFTGKLYDEQKQLVQQWLGRGYGLIQAPPRSGKCVVGSSLVVTEDGIVPITDLRPGMQVQSGSGLARVSAYHHREASSTLKMRTHCGYEIHGTPEHPVLTIDNQLEMRWLPIDQVVPGTHKVAVAWGTDTWAPAPPMLPVIDPSVQYHTTNIYPTPRRLTAELARLLGYLIGEGSLAHQPCHVTNTDPHLLRDFRHCVRECFGTDAKETTDKRNGVKSVGVSSVYLATFLSGCGLRLAVSGGQAVPWCILRAPRDMVVQFLRAYFDADGTASSRDNIDAVSASEELIWQVQLLLLNLGIVSRRTVRRVASPHSGTVRPYYRLMLHGADIRRFHERVGFGLERKQTFRDCNRKHDRAAVLPFVGAALRTLAKRGRFGWYRMADGSKQQIRLAKTVNHGRDDDTSAYEFAHDPGLIRRIARIDKGLAVRIGELLERGHFWDDVTMVEEGGAQPVYDVTVPEHHSFVANGLIVHNTVMMTAIVCKLRQRTLMLAHLEDLCHQLEETIRKFTNVNELEDECGSKLVGVLDEWDDFFPIATLTTYQCLAVSPTGRRVLRERRNDFGLVMCDESHRVAAECFQTVVNSTTAAYRCGVTATPTRKDGMHCVVSDTLGPVVAVGKGEQLSVQYTWEYTGIEVKPFSNWSIMWNRLVRFRSRDKLIANKVMEDVRAGHFVLVTTERLRHLDDLKLAIQKVDPDVTVGLLSSRTKDRESFRTAAKRGDFQVVIAMNKIVELGYNIPRWSCFHNTLPMANRQNWYQRISRIRTPMERAFDGDDWQKPTPLARIWLDSGHAAVYAYKAIVKRENDRLGFECLNPPAERPKGKRKGLVGYVKQGD